MNRVKFLELTQIRRGSANRSAKRKHLSMLEHTFYGLDELPTRVVILEMSAGKFPEIYSNISGNFFFRKISKFFY